MIMGHVSPSNPRQHIAMIVWLHVLLLMTPGVSSLGNELFSCDFENDLCGIIQDTNDHFNWTRHHGSTNTPNTGPRVAYNGTYYIYTEANQHWEKVASLRTPALGYQGQACVSVAYHMYGTSINQLRVSTSPDNDRLWHVTGDQGNRWLERAEQVNLDYGDGIQLQGYTAYGNTGDIAVDNLVITEGSCKEEVSLPYHCSFETGWCGMTQGYDDNFDWTRYDRYTGTPNTGPRRASDLEWFIYIETSTSGRRYGYTALIETPAFNHTGSLCLRFHYHMYGNHVGTLTALHSTSRASSNAFQQTGNKGDTWFSAAVNVTDFQPDDWITFRASRGDSIYGDIAVDNINIAAGGCRDCRTLNGSCQHYCIPESTGDRCACYHGYRLDGETSCADINECSEDTAGCSQHCVNTDGGFTCHCNDGFRLDKDNSTCQDIDECAENTAGCSQNCNNSDGGFTCYCDDGFRLDKDNSTCQDIDECLEQTAGCSQLCNNTDGGFTCRCGDGFRLDKDKTTCQVQPEKNVSAALIAGAASAAAVVVCLVIIVLLVLIIRRRRQKTNREVEAYAYVNVGRSRDLEMDTMDKGCSVKPASDKDPSLEVRRPSQMYATVVPKTQRPQKADTHDKDRPGSSTAKPEIAVSALPVKPEENAGKTDDASDEIGDAESVTEEQTDEAGSIAEIPPKCTEPNEEQHADTVIEQSGLYYNLPPTATIQASDFPAHVKELQKNKGFEKEYKRLPSGKLSDWEAATRQDLKAKNRFKNIYPYDSNRVRMNTFFGDPNSDYINASHIQGFSENDRYIASHGPTPLTKHDFWRMIWEQDVTVVVMVTNLLEDGTIRCVKYWPDKEEVMTYDDITVVLTKEEKLPDFTMRVWKLTKAGEEERVVEHCHYTSWPDHGVPEDATSILRFHKRVKQRMKPGKPTVVHCSAGVGRTGTFIAIDYLLNQAEETQSLDVYGCVSRLRHQRIQMVQTQSQYEFIHTTLVEALVIGDTTIPCDSFHDKIKDMKHVIQDQFQYLEELKSAYSKEDIELANNEKNKAKNMKAHIIPRGTTRVFLTSQEHDRNDYINAVFVHSYHKRNAYIATQLPLSDTTIDFWRMIHDLRCDTIVLIGHSMAELFNGEDGMEHEIGKYHVTTTCPVGSPLGEDLQQTTVTVDKAFLPPTYANAEMMAQEDDDKAADNIYRVSCRVIVVPSPSAGYLSSAILTRMFAVVKDGERSNETFTVFVCGDGAALSGVAIACFSLFEMMPIEDAVDVFHVVKQIKDSRPEFISTLDQYSHLYDVAGEYIKQYGTYSNFR